MTEPTNNNQWQRAQYEGQLEDAREREENLTGAIRTRFGREWEREFGEAPSISASLTGPGWAELVPPEGNSAAQGPVDVLVDLDTDERAGLALRNGPNLNAISNADAATRLGVDESTLAAAVATAERLMRDDAVQHQALTTLADEHIPQLEAWLGLLDKAERASVDAERERVEEALDDALDLATNLESTARLHFAQGWQNQPALDALPLEAGYHGPGWVTFAPEEGNTSATGLVRLSYDRDARSGQETVTLSMPDGWNHTPITEAAAANRLGVDVEVMAAAVNGARNLVFADYALHQSIRELQQEQIPGLEHDLEVRDAEPAEPEWATDSLDAPYTPERITADWVQSTTMVQTYIECDRPDLAREWINTLDENLASFAEGGYPPESPELEDVYHDAVARAAIPYGEAPISPEEVRRQLGNISRPVPEFDAERVRKAAGMSALGREHLMNWLDREAELPTGMQEVAAARLSVRRAMVDISENTEQAQQYLSSANEKLTQALDGMRPDQHHDNVTAAQQSLQSASEKVAAVAETAEKVDAEVTVYTTDGCPGCFATKRALDKAGVEYDEISLQDRPDLVAKFKRQLGKEGEKITAPVVQTKDGDLWAGYNPGKLKEHGLDYRTRQQRSGETGRDTGHGR